MKNKGNSLILKVLSAVVSFLMHRELINLSLVRLKCINPAFFLSVTNYNLHKSKYLKTYNYWEQTIGIWVGYVDLRKQQ